MCDAIIAVLYDSDLYALGITMDDVEDVLRDTCEDWAIGPAHCMGAYYPAHRHVYAKKMPDRDATNYLFSLPLKNVSPVEETRYAKLFILEYGPTECRRLLTHRDYLDYLEIRSTLESLYRLRGAGEFVGVDA